MINKLYINRDARLDTVWTMGVIRKPMSLPENFNPSNWHDVRELDWIPDHFTVVPVDPGSMYNNHDMLRSWVLENTQGRFAFGERPRWPRANTVAVDENNYLLQAKSWLSKLSEHHTVGSSKTIGFENPSDATTFVLQYKMK